MPYPMPPRLTERWSKYWADFQVGRAGITEEVLARSVAGTHNPYCWLARSVSASALTVLDIGCGSGAMSRELEADGRTVVGLDLSDSQWHQASQRQDGTQAGQRPTAGRADRRPAEPFVVADALRLPFADDSFDAVTSAMGLATVRPVKQLLAEVARVLRPGGVFAAMMPSVRPLKPTDIVVGAKLAATLRAVPRFSGAVELELGRLLQVNGLKRVENARQCYHYLVRSRGDAEMLVAAWYLTDTQTERVQSAVDYLVEQVDQLGSIEVPIPIRRIIAIK